jgi:hypothetical protein
MPVYLFTVVTRTGTGRNGVETHAGIREIADTNIDWIFQKAESKCRLKWGEKLESFDVVMISRRSPKYTQLVAKRGERGKILPADLRDVHPYNRGKFGPER